MSTHVVGFAPPDAKWTKMKIAHDACRHAEVEVPDVIRKFFNWEEPDARGRGVRIELDERYVTEFNEESSQGLEVDVESLCHDYPNLQTLLLSSACTTMTERNKMQKIPTLFERDDKFRVIDEVREGCEWVLAGEGIATEKVDGTNVRLTLRSGEIVRIEKRRNPTKLQKKAGIVDPWYTDTSESEPSDKWIRRATTCQDFTHWSDGEHCCEAMGEHIQGNPLQLVGHHCYQFNSNPFSFGIGAASRSFEALKAILDRFASNFNREHLAEGIVFHHPDGRRAKIKRCDFTNGR